MIGERIYLRLLEPEDTDRCARWINDPEVNYGLISEQLHFNRVREREWIDGLYRDDTSITFGICLKADGRHIGNIGLNLIDRVSRTAHFGILIGEKDEWGKGYATEATKLVVEYAFNVQNLQRVELVVFEFNERAHACYKKAGFVEEGRLRRKRYKRGKYYDEILMAILRDE
ncbi:MAG: GNAT family N-acetyltransferase [Deltaproteobacteria bacterium]|nr:GNAT family N-acetyltransferase [Deltaproteobacteria bacterium]